VNKMFMCPLMNNMNMGLGHGMYPQMYSDIYMDGCMPEDVESIFAEDDRDDEYFDGMHPDSCKKIMPYIDRELDRMETEESPLYDDYPEREMMDRLGDKIYDKVVADMPDMEEQWEGRQFGRRRFLRDLIGVLLLSNLARRRRRRRRRRFDNFNNYWYNY
jgi:hypothetical protein